jgi:cytochrome c biogenesis protein CcmG/thiol:disulfide interchange protein DsbE
MEQTIAQPPQTASAGRTMFVVTGFIALLSLLVVMAINLRSVASTDLKDQPAPDFSLSLFSDFEPGEIVLSELRGQVVVVNFWASWCLECYKEAALLEQAWKDYQAQGVMFIGVDYLDTPSAAQAYMTRYGITYPSGPDLGDIIAKDYAITGVPETFFIGKDGHIAHIQIGPISEAELYRLLDQLVAEPYNRT